MAALHCYMGDEGMMGLTLCNSNKVTITVHTPCCHVNL
jgi:hypothetical protein